MKQGRGAHAGGVRRSGGNAYDGEAASPNCVASELNGILGAAIAPLAAFATGAPPTVRFGSK